MHLWSLGTEMGGGEEGLKWVLARLGSRKVLKGGLGTSETPRGLESLRPSPSTKPQDAMELPLPGCFLGLSQPSQTLSLWGALGVYRLGWPESLLLVSVHLPLPGLTSSVEWELG